MTRPGDVLEESDGSKAKLKRMFFFWWGGMRRPVLLQSFSEAVVFGCSRGITVFAKQVRHRSEQLEAVALAASVTALLTTRLDD